VKKGNEEKMEKERLIFEDLDSRNERMHVFSPSLPLFIERGYIWISLHNRFFSCAAIFKAPKKDKYL
jgi:hypothetical protein